MSPQTPTSRRPTTANGMHDTGRHARWRSSRLSRAQRCLRAAGKQRWLRRPQACAWLRHELHAALQALLFPGHGPVPRLFVLFSESFCWAQCGLMKRNTPMHAQRVNA
jgi:hypothetical protein